MPCLLLYFNPKLPTIQPFEAGGAVGEAVTRHRCYNGICEQSGAFVRRRRGIVPCRIFRKKTHAYQIRKAAVLEYLIQRDITPEKYGYRNGSYSLAFEKAMSDANPESDANKSDCGIDRFCDFDMHKDISFKYPLYTEYPDVLTTKQAAALSGFAQSTVNDWVKMII
jgi:hypothetical protein